MLLLALVAVAAWLVRPADAQTPVTTTTSTSCTATSFVVTTFTTTTTSTTTMTILSGCTVDADCDDGDACTRERCADPSTGTCASRNVFCQNGNACDGFETCDASVGCVPGTPLDCDDGNACTEDLCFAQFGCWHRPFLLLECVGPGIRDCDDFDRCTVDACDPGSGCLFPPNDCDDFDACTADVCDPDVGCVHTGGCDDGDPCTADVCTREGTCEHHEGCGMCEPVPLSGCVGAAEAKLVIKEKKAGVERLKLALRSLEAPLAQEDFGDPVSGTTGYLACLYDQTDQIVGTFVVDDAGETCGSKPCWRAVGRKGYRYANPDGNAFVRSIVAKGGAAGSGKVVLKGWYPSHGGGIADALAGTNAVTVQFRTDVADLCVGGRIESVRRADPDVFRAVGPAVADPGPTSTSSSTSTSTSTTTSTTPLP
jgi:hypothetical protein